MAATKVSVKLLIDNKINRVLFAEAGKDFIDFLFSLMSLPIGTVTRLLTNKSMVGSIGNLYDSIENISDTYLESNLVKDCLLKPKAPASALNVPLLLPNCDNATVAAAPAAKNFYHCNWTNSYTGCKANVTDDPKAVCTCCGNLMNIPMKYIAPPGKVVTGTSEGSGFVKAVVTYMVMDDLVVTPMSTISSITLLNKFGVTGIDTLQERVVNLGIDEGLKLLKESLQSKKVLTNVFLQS